jgi:hypothetical protein
MRQIYPPYLDFRVDKLTSSIQHVASGEPLETEVVRLQQGDQKLIKKKDWTFDWHAELLHGRKQIFKLVTIANPCVVHGLISITDKKDHIFMDLIESAKFNKGKNKLYYGVAGNLVAYACKLSFERKYDGIVSFVAKTQLIEHYRQSLGAKLFGGNRMFIDTREALVLTKQYFKQFNL